MKAMQKNATAVADAYRPELVEGDEQRRLRRKKPLELRRKESAGKQLSLYRTIFVWLLFTSCLGLVAYVAADFLLHSPKVLLLKPEQSDDTRTHTVFAHP